MASDIPSYHNNGSEFIDISPLTGNQKDDKSILHRVFDMTGEAFEKFGNFLRGESSDKKFHGPYSEPMKSERTSKPPLHNQRAAQSFMETIDYANGGHNRVERRTEGGIPTYKSNNTLSSSPQRKWDEDAPHSLVQDRSYLNVQVVELDNNYNDFKNTDAQ
jgi:hypothetical protein